MYGCFGALYRSSTFASSTSLPRYMTATRSLMYSTTDRSWLMKRYVSPNSWRRSTRRLRIWERMDTSSADTGSSHTMKSGLSASARAIPIRCRWPPENSWG